MVKLRLTSRGENAEILERELEETFKTLLSRVDPWLVLHLRMKARNSRRPPVAGTGNDPGGSRKLHRRIYRPPSLPSSGSSAYYKGSVVAYANSVKERTSVSQSDPGLPSGLSAGRR